LSEETEFDWDTKVELLEIELESLRIAIEKLAKKFEGFQDKYGSNEDR
jgi:hypothetical protein